MNIVKFPDHIASMFPRKAMINLWLLPAVYKNNYFTASSSSLEI